MNTPANATQIPVGHSFDIDFQIFQTRITFASPTQLTFKVLTGSAAGPAQTVEYRVVVLRPGLFAVSWQEPDNTTVVHLEDLAEGQVHAHITQPDGKFLRLSGKISSWAPRSCP
ncbi:MoaF-related domain-containing protein [Actinoplanes sp. CA-142083]|uniref:MoaF-related domain-containing protein n=1 Tax=Actinoplanes sp. CA-142083 TaxID=3239903 RepID=UPI003D942DDD